MKKKYPGIILALLLFTLFWQIVSLLVTRPFLPGPVKAWEALLRLAAAGKLGVHLGASLSRIFWAFLITTVPAAALGLAAGRSGRFDRIISPIIYILHPMPKAAFLPVIMLFLGLGEASKIFLVGFIIFSQILMSTRDAARGVPAELLDSVRSLGAGKAGLLCHVIIPSVLPGFFTGLRISLGTAVAVLFIAETFASNSGLGFLIMDAWTRVAYAEMYAAILALSLLGLVLYALLDLAEILICPWKLN
ncbi:MAG: ABC transporter permease [Treponema sp.]|nr:ABC transporter permease [Treponema sp.]